jgi:Flp pilus assembly protein TadB
MVVHVGRRTVSFTQQPGTSPLQRVVALVLLVPLLVLVVALGAVLLAMLLFVALIVALVLSAAALVFGRRVQRGR